jgi:hypothetical protein
MVKDIAEVLLISLMIFMAMFLNFEYLPIWKLLYLSKYNMIMIFSLQARDDEPQITMFGQDLPFIKEKAAASSPLAFSLSSSRMRIFL